MVAIVQMHLMRREKQKNAGRSSFELFDSDFPGVAVAVCENCFFETERP